MASARVTAVKGGRNGALTLTLRAPAAGRVLVEAFAKKGLLAAKPPRGTKRVARASKSVSKAGTVKLKLKTTGKGKRKLKRGGKLKATLRVAFTPAAGAAPAATTRSVTFRARRRSGPRR